MFRNYLKIALRNLLRNKGFSITNILGLTIGCASTLFILLWVHDELTFNKFHQNYENIYQVMANRNYNEEIFTDQNMVLPLANAIQSELPEVEQAVTATFSESHILGNGETKARKIGITASDNFFKVLSWEFLEGNEATALPDASSIVLTESTAKSLFGTEDPMHKTVKLDNATELTVTGILKDIPSNSTFQFDYIHAFNYSDEGLLRSLTNWTNSSWNVFLKVPPGTDEKELSEKITALKIRNSPNDKGISEYFAFPMSKWRLYAEFKEGVNTGGMIQYVKMFSIIAVIMLLVACVNFMNLSTARSERRAKEVGIRKTLGSDKKQLMLQFFFESMLLTLSAFFLSLLVVLLLMPYFNELVVKKLTLDLSSPIFWIISGVIVVFTGMVAGSYPALYLSSFSPVKVLKGTFLAGEKAVLPRNILVVGQFVASILLISGTLIVYQQIQYIKNRDMGYNPNNLVMVSSSDDIQKNFSVIKDELLKSGKIQGVTRTFSPITSVWWRSPAPSWEGKPTDMNLLMAGLYTDVGFSETMGVKMIQGNDFTGMPSDSTSLILNRAAVEAMGLKEPVGTQMRYNGETYNVIGVTENVVMDSPFKPVEPMMIFFSPEITYSISVRFKDGIPVQDGLLAMEEVFKTYNPSVPFEYQFVDQEFGRKFVSEELVSKLTNIFAALTIFVCCIGLAGLASYTIEKRFREIGIRKVLGASVPQVLLLISSDFLKLVLIAFCIAAPLAYWKMGEWLETYTYHVTMNFWLFIGVGGLVLFLALAVVTANTMKAALANPVKSLKSE
ncbi:ABC transporter permease [Algoriphagus aestuariicola]|uniref:ABC transporter permease n=1 Tax=Algoriphagus aestuariicola TaxID=1852016 RepID=A0ABS3BM04_9BACT|nr:ABC transporter permease [Algoriphagus aestuariicola]MBN7800338.1 ABC transporter permease [Algoriphagus aestuariicola]